MAKLRINTLVVLAVILALISIVAACTSSATTAPSTTTPTETTTAPPATSASPSVTAAPSPSVTAAPSPSVTVAPSPSPTAAPSPTATAAPSPTSTAAPSASATAAPTASAAGSPVTIDLIAQNIAFDKKTITVSAGAQVTMNFDNRDSGIPHNFALYTDSSASTPIFVGQIINGPATTTYTFTSPATPGTYYFRCDPHANIMNGQFIVQ